jgi:hypothetical protein
MTDGKGDSPSGAFQVQVLDEECYYLHVDDDLPALVRESERIRQDRLYTLRFLTLQGPRS